MTRTERHHGTADLSGALVDSALYCAGVRTGGTVPLDQAAERVRGQEGAFVWVGLDDPDEAALLAVAAELGLPELAVEDAVHAHQRPKLEEYGEQLFVVLKSVRYVDSREVVVIGEVMVFLGPGFVVTVRYGDAPDLSPLRRALEERPELLAHGPATVLWAVADSLVDGYGPALAGVEQDVDEVEGQVFGAEQGDPTQRIYQLKREVLSVARAVHPLVEVTDRLSRGGVACVVPELSELLRDVHDHVLRADEQVSGLDSLLGSVLDANATQVSLRQNEDMRKISAYAAILAVCTTVAGVYGMNFENMPELSWQYGYPYALVLMVVPSVLLYRGFKRNGWL